MNDEKLTLKGRKNKMLVKRAVDSVLKNGKSKSAIIKKFTKNKNVDYPAEGELFERILKLLHEYDGEMSFAACIGVLDLVKNSLMNEI